MISTPGSWRSPDESSDAFLVKFQRQLAGAPDATVQLAAEALYVHFLIASMSGAAKRAVIEPVLGWMHEPVTIPADLDAALDHGIASPGTAFHTRRPFQLGFVIEFARAWKALPEDRRDAALRDPWAFKDVLFAVPMPKGSYTQREALLHLVHPDTFESIVSRGHKEQIATAFGRPPTADDPDVDRRLAAVRAQLETEYGRPIDWYEDEIEPAMATGAHRRRPPKPSVAPGVDLPVEPRPIRSRRRARVARRVLLARSAIRAGDPRRRPGLPLGGRIGRRGRSDRRGRQRTRGSRGLRCRPRRSGATQRHSWVRVAECSSRSPRSSTHACPEPRLRRTPRLAKLPNLVFAQGTNFPLTPEQDQELQRVIAGMAHEPSALTFEALQQETGWDADRLRELADAIILGRRQVVIAGRRARARRGSRASSPGTSPPTSRAGFGSSSSTRATRTSSSSRACDHGSRTTGRSSSPGSTGSSSTS